MRFVICTQMLESALFAVSRSESRVLDTNFFVIHNQIKDIHN